MTEKKETRDLHVAVGGKEVLKGVNLRIHEGEVHVLLGPNGCGKSTLLNTIMGLSQYTVLSGTIIYKGVDVTHMPIDERARRGLGLMHQKPPTVQGLPLTKLVKAAFPENRYDAAVETTNISKLLERDVNCGFSGGEVKRSEVFQLLMQLPELAMLDEPESGVDLENISLLGAACRTLYNFGSDGVAERAGLLITHTGHIMDYVPVTSGHILVDGVIRCSGDPYRLYEVVKERGYYFCVKCSKRDGSSPCDCVSCDDKHSARFYSVLHLNTPKVSKVADGKVRLTIDDVTIMASATPRSSSNEPVQTQTQTQRQARVMINMDDDITMSGESVVMNVMDKQSLQLEDVFDIKNSGSFCQINQTIREYFSTFPGLEVMPLGAAMTKYPWIRDRCYWKALDHDKDDVTRAVYAQEQAGHMLGYVVLAQAGVVVPEAVNCAVLLERDYERTTDATGCVVNKRRVQSLHNIVIALPGSILHITSTCATCGGCSAAPMSDKYTEDTAVGEHNGVTEFYGEANSQLSMTMVHRFGGDYIVYPRSAALLHENAIFYNNYVCLNPVRKVQMYPTAILQGEGAVAKFSSVLVADKGTLLDIGSRAILNAKNTRVEMNSRAITRGGKIVARGHIQGNVEDTYGRIECNGLCLSNGIIHALPEIEGCVEGTELSHEASVGKLDRDKLDYLMSRSLSEDQAVGLIIRGFLDLKIPGLLPEMQESIRAVIEEAAAGF